MTGKLALIGYRGLKVPQFYHLLQEEGIDVLLDVRRNPYSPNPSFRRDSLLRSSEEFGVRYHHLPELGAPGAGHSTIPIGAPTTMSEQLATPQALHSLRRILKSLQKGTSLALMCAEADYHECHREAIVKLLSGALPIETVELTGKPSRTLFDLIPA